MTTASYAKSGFVQPNTITLETTKKTILQLNTVKATGNLQFSNTKTELRSWSLFTKLGIHRNCR